MRALIDFSLLLILKINISNVPCESLCAHCGAKATVPFYGDPVRIQMCEDAYLCEECWFYTLRQQPGDNKTRPKCGVDCTYFFKELK